MFVIDFSPHLGKKKYPVRNLRISPDAGTLAATFGEEGRAEHAAWLSLAEGKLIGTSDIYPPKEDRVHDSETVEPAFTPDLAHCAVQGSVQATNNDDADFVVLVEPGVSYRSGAMVGFGYGYSEACRLELLAFAPDDRKLVASLGQGSVCRWDLGQVDLAHAAKLRPNNIIWEEDNPGAVFPAAEFMTLAHDGENDRDGVGGSALAVSNDGKWLGTGWDDGVVRIYDFVSCQPVATVQSPFRKGLAWVRHIPKCSVRRLCFSPDDQQLASWQDGRVTISVLTGEPTNITLEATDLSSMAFTRDGKRLLTGGSDKLVRVWDTATWTEVAQYDWKVGPIHSVAVSPDGAIAAAGGGKNRVVVWDLDE